MPIYEYAELDHPAGFIGLRVSVSVGGKLKQKYFAFRKRGEYVTVKEERQIRREANALHESWLVEQEDAKHKSNSQAKEIRGSVYCTGVRGIKLKFAVEKKFREGTWKKYYSPIFYVSGSVEGEPFSRRFYISEKQPYRTAWRKAVLYYANKKRIKARPLLRRRPDRKQLRQVWRHMVKQGHAIPKSKVRVP
jgi:hypothetical protein